MYRNNDIFHKKSNKKMYNQRETFNSPCRLKIGLHHYRTKYIAKYSRKLNESPPKNNK